MAAGGTQNVTFVMQMVDKASRGFNTINRNLDKMTRKQRAAKRASEMFAAALSAMLIASVLFFRRAMNAFADFQKEVMQAAAIGTRAGGNIRETYGKMSKAALHFGATTMFTASQAANALRQFAQAGYTAEEAIGAVGGALKFAAVTGGDLSASVALVSTTLKQFDLSVGSSMKLADQFTIAVTSSRLDIYNLREALKEAGPAAHGLGISLEETLPVLMKFADMGYEGSRSGVKFRSGLVLLGRESRRASGTMAKLGLTYEDLDVQTKGLTTVLETLADSGLARFSDAVNLFGSRAAGSWLRMVTILQQGGDEATNELRKFAADFEEAGGEASRIEKEMMNTVWGSQKLLVSAWESLLHGIMAAQEGWFRDMIDAWRDFIRYITEEMNTERAFAPVMDDILELREKINTGEVQIPVGIDISVTATDLLRGTAGAMGRLGLLPGGQLLEEDTGDMAKRILEEAMKQYNEQSEKLRKKISEAETAGVLTSQPGGRWHPEALADLAEYKYALAELDDFFMANIIPMWEAGQEASSVAFDSLAEGMKKLSGDTPLGPAGAAGGIDATLSSLQKLASTMEGIPGELWSLPFEMQKIAIDDLLDLADEYADRLGDDWVPLVRELTKESERLGRAMDAKPLGMLESARPDSDIAAALEKERNERIRLALDERDAMRLLAAEYSDFNAKQAAFAQSKGAAEMFDTVSAAVIRLGEAYGFTSSKADLFAGKLIEQQPAVSDTTGYMESLGALMKDDMINITQAFGGELADLFSTMAEGGDTTGWVNAMLKNIGRMAMAQGIYHLLNAAAIALIPGMQGSAAAEATGGAALVALGASLGAASRLAPAGGGGGGGGGARTPSVGNTQAGGEEFTQVTVYNLNGPYVEADAGSRIVDMVNQAGRQNGSRINTTVVGG